MSKPEIRIHPWIDGDCLKVAVDRIDRSTKTYESLNADGEWEPVSLYSRDQGRAFTLTPERTKKLLAELTGEASA